MEILVFAIKKVLPFFQFFFFVLQKNENFLFWIKKNDWKQKNKKDNATTAYLPCRNFKWGRGAYFFGWRIDTKLAGLLTAKIGLNTLEWKLRKTDEFCFRAIKEYILFGSFLSYNLKVYFLLFIKYFTFLNVTYNI